MSPRVENSVNRILVLVFRDFLGWHEEMSITNGFQVAVRNEIYSVINCIKKRTDKIRLSELITEHIIPKVHKHFMRVLELDSENLNLSDELKNMQAHEFALKYTLHEYLEDKNKLRTTLSRVLDICIPEKEKTGCSLTLIREILLNKVLQFQNLQ